MYSLLLIFAASAAAALYVCQTSCDIKPSEEVTYIFIRQTKTPVSLCAATQHETDDDHESSYYYTVYLWGLG